jgi:hypothetical protein
MFPAPGAIIYRNEAGEVTGWDQPCDDPPEPADGPYRSGATVEIRTALTDAAIAAQAAGYHGSVTLTRVRPMVLREVDRGAEDVVLYSAERSVYLGTVQDYDLYRAEVTVELR